MEEKNDTNERRSRLLRRSASLGLFAGLTLLGLLAMSCGGEAGAAPADGATLSSGPGASAKAQISVPSRSAMMICAPGIRLIVEKTLGLPELPPIATSWVDQLYTCTYNLDGGPLVLSVKELPDAAAAQQYLAGLSAHIGAAEPIVGVASLGLAGYETASGIVLFAKDDTTLEIDASDLPDASGPSQLTRADFAYQIATNILACWSGE